MTYYKRAQRSAATQVDWGKVGQDMTEMIATERDIRDGMKAELDQQARDQAEMFASPPLGEHADANRYVTQFSNDISEYALLTENLLKSGQMRVSDYTNIRANLEQGTNDAFSMATEYQEEYATKMERQKNGEAQALEEFLMATSEGFGNFSSTSLFIDPANGQVSAAKMITNPDTGMQEMSTSPNDRVKVNDLKMRMKARYDAFDMEGSLASSVDNLGSKIKVMMKGNVKTLESAMNSPEYLNMERDLVNQQLAVPTNTSSILTNIRKTNDEGVPFGFTFDLEEAANDPSKILLVDNPDQPTSGAPIPGFDVEVKANLDAVPPVTQEMADRINANRESQMAMAKETVTNRLRGMLDEKETARPEKWWEKSSQAEARSGSEKVEDQAVGSWNQIFNATTPEDRQMAVRKALNEPGAKANNIKDIDFTTEGEFTILYKDGTSQSINLPENPTLQQWAELGNSVHGVSDVTEVMKRSGGGDPSSTLVNRDFSNISAGITDAPTQITGYDEVVGNSSKSPRNAYTEALGENPEDPEFSVMATAAQSALATAGLQSTVRFVNENDIPSSEGLFGINNDAIEYFVPSVMTEPIYIPDDGDVPKSTMEEVNKMVLDAAKLGRAITTKDFRSIFDGATFDAYNNEKVREARRGQWGSGASGTPATTNPNVARDTSGY